ncbi:GTPase ObgE [Venenivibrio stagnispumantis]|uniref:GTPase Obg n=1 Tax=Venenivibrio stagnispumantis TaxID=407998 RepID=A0AA45WJ47_9AQUI|nr:GTPase ObgE [Venenivibrio stagnispumantis]MCW4572495.1 GTPase ObgE [Venenivibrio stagnispumantis]SMP02259.1 GTP-binding protein [Venenivibrio stagnispumantis]
MFIDKAKIYVKAGDGGNGCVAFHREKFVPMGGPSGGNGGKGGDVIIVADSKLQTLMDFKYKRHYKAEKGQNGQGGNKTGKDGKDLYIKVPVGTVVKDAQTGEILADLVEEGQSVIVAKGGKGGKGNAAFKTATNQAPTNAEPGEKGEERWIELELKLIADVGIIGFPNAGKSTLISVLSKARPKIADYPFTTLTPVLGVIEFDIGDYLILADIPGLIEGASKGAGLGHEFLRHIERTKYLIHLIDVSDFRERDPIEAFKIINKELKEYSPKLLKKPQIVVANKIDALSDKSLIDKLKDYFTKEGYKFFAVSLITKEGLDELINELRKIKESMLSKV